MIAPGSLKGAVKRRFFLVCPSPLLIRSFAGSNGRRFGANSLLCEKLIIQGNGALFNWHINVMASCEYIIYCYTGMEVGGMENGMGVAYGD